MLKRIIQSFYVYFVIHCAMLLGLMLIEPELSIANSDRQRPSLALLQQVFPHSKLSEVDLQRFSLIQVDLNGDKKNELIFVEDPNPPEQTSPPKKPICLCPPPKLTDKEQQVMQALGKDFTSAVYQIQLEPKKQRRRTYHDLKIWWKLEMIKPDMTHRWIIDACRDMALHARKWAKWQLREVSFVRSDNGENYSLSWTRCQNLRRVPAKRVERQLKSWLRSGEPTPAKTCKCPPIKKKRVMPKLQKPLNITVCAEKTASTPAVPADKKPDAEIQPQPIYEVIARYQAEDAQLSPLTRAGDVVGLRLERTEREVKRAVTESIYVYDTTDTKRMKRVFHIEKSREIDRDEPDVRSWIDLRITNLDQDDWMEIIADVYFENAEFNGLIGRRMFKWHNGQYVPLNNYRGIYRVQASSTLQKIAPKASSRLQQILRSRTVVENLIDGFGDTAWIGNRTMRGIGEWVRLEWSKNTPMLGVAINTLPPKDFNPLVPSFWRSLEKYAPKLYPPRFVRIQTSTGWETMAELPEGGGVYFVQFPSVVHTSFVQISIIDNYIDPKTKHRQKLQIPPKENSVAYISELIPITTQIRYTASSFVNMAGEIWMPEHVGDQRPETAWAEGRRDDGIGEWIQMLLPIPQTLQQITVINGCQRPGEKYVLNNRVKEALLTFSDGSTQEVLLKDTHEPQKLSIRSIRTNSVKLTIRSVYKGKVGSLTCISEFRP